MRYWLYKPCHWGLDSFSISMIYFCQSCGAENYDSVTGNSLISCSGCQSAWVSSLPINNQDAFRWQAGCLFYFPEFCGHDDAAPKGHGWFHQDLLGKWFDTPSEAMDAV